MPGLGVAPAMVRNLLWGEVASSDVHARTGVARDRGACQDCHLAARRIIGMINSALSVVACWIGSYRVLGPHPLDLETAHDPPACR